MFRGFQYWLKSITRLEKRYVLKQLTNAKVVCYLFIRETLNPLEVRFDKETQVITTSQGSLCRLVSWTHLINSGSAGSLLRGRNGNQHHPLVKREPVTPTEY